MPITANDLDHLSQSDDARASVGVFGIAEMQQQLGARIVGRLAPFVDVQAMLAPMVRCGDWLPNVAREVGALGTVQQRLIKMVLPQAAVVSTLGEFTASASPSMLSQIGVDVAAMTQRITATIDLGALSGWTPVRVGGVVRSGSK